MSADADHEVIDSPEALFRHLYEAHHVEEALDLDPETAPVQFWLRRHAELEREARAPRTPPAAPPAAPPAGREGRRPVPFGDPLVEAGCVVKRFHACVPIWGITATQRRQMVAVGGNLMSFDLISALWREPELAVVHSHALGRIGDPLAIPALVAHCESYTEMWKLAHQEVKRRGLASSNSRPRSMAPRRSCSAPMARPSAWSRRRKQSTMLASAKSTARRSAGR